MDQALTLCRALVAEGITRVIATPHQLGRFEGCFDAEQIHQAVRDLNAEIIRSRIPLEVLPGAEIRVDERVPQWLQEGRLLTLGHAGDHLLLEMPFELFLDIRPLLAALQGSGLTTIMAHPERHESIAADPALALSWSAYGALLQVTAASLVGEFGPLVQQAAWDLLDLPMTVLVATDAHPRSIRRPCLAEAFEAVAGDRGMDFARRIFVENPQLVLENQHVQPARLRKERG
jgi:protein-tyrosine phosphatase